MPVDPSVGEVAINRVTGQLTVAPGKA